MSNHGKNIVVSGTYGVGKTTTVAELAHQTRMPTAVARGMRDILPEVFPGIGLNQCTPDQLIQLGLIRFSERVKLEAALPNGFISDGSALHEWAYGHARSLESTDGNGPAIHQSDFSFAMKAYGDVVKRYAKAGYTDVVHLPIEFPLPTDGHRPVSEKFRTTADDLIIGTWYELGFKPLIVRGSVRERVAQIVDALELDVSRTIDGPEIDSDGAKTYMHIDDILGPGGGRFFSNGFRNIEHDISGITISPNGHAISAMLNVFQRGQWSTKEGAECVFHLSSIDAIRIGGQLAQALLYNMDDLTRDESNNMWLRNLEIKPGKKPIESMTDIPLEGTVESTKILSMRGYRWRIASMRITLGTGGFVVTADVAMQLPSSSSAHKSESL